MYESLLYIIKNVVPWRNFFYPNCHTLVPPQGAKFLEFLKTFQDALWFSCLLSDCWLPWMDMNPDRHWGSHSRLKIRLRTRLKLPSSKGIASHFKEPVVTSGQQWPLTCSLHERKWRGMSSNLKPAERSFQVQAGPSPVCQEWGKVLAAFPVGKCRHAFCHFKNPIERNLTNPRGVTTDTWEIFFVCAAGLIKEESVPWKWDLLLKTALYVCQQTYLLKSLVKVIFNLNGTSWLNKEEKKSQNVGFNCGIKTQIHNLSTQNNQVWVTKK